MTALAAPVTETTRPSRRVGALRDLILRAEGLRKAFGGQEVLRDVTLQLRRGEVVLIRGANGSGKTTLLNLLTGHLAPDAGVIHVTAIERSAVFTFPTPWWQKLHPFDPFVPEHLARLGIGRTWQETRLFATQSLRANLALAAPAQLGESPLWAVLRRGTVRRQEARLREEAGRGLAALGLGDRAESSADRVSLGQAKRVGIARAVQAGTRLLFLDEPLAGLDDDGIATLLELLETLCRTERLTLVLVEHALNLRRVLPLATTVWTLAEGRLESESPARVGAGLGLAAGEATASWLAQLTGPGTVEETRLPGRAVLTRWSPPDGERAGAAEEPVLEVADLVVCRGRRMVVGRTDADGTTRGFSLTLRRGDVAVLRAPNGWGKSTVLEAIAGLTPASSGAVRVRGQSVERRSAWERRRQGLSLLQARSHTFPGLKVREALRVAGVREPPAEVQSLLDRRCADLSGGEKQRVALACALDVAGLHVALLDEPFTALDLPTLRRVWARIANSRTNYGLLVAVPGLPEESSLPNGGN